MKSDTDLLDTNKEPQDGNSDNYAVAILVLGICSIMCFAPCGVAALILRYMKKDQISKEKQPLVTAGFVTSIIGIIFWVLALALSIGVGLLLFWAIPF